MYGNFYYGNFYYGKIHKNNFVYKGYVVLFPFSSNVL